jgi:hypothetical protein
MVNGFYMPIEWNYPGAHTQGILYAKNITGVTSKDRTTLSTPVFLYSHSLGNFTVDSLHIEDFYGLSSVLRMNIFLVAVPFWMTSDITQRHFLVNDVHISLKNPNNELNRFNTFIVGTNGNFYTQNHMNLTNIFVHDYNEGALFPLGSAWNLNDELYITNLQYDNSKMNDYGVLLAYWGLIVIKDLTYQNTVGMSLPLVYTVGLRDIQYYDSVIKNFTGPSVSQYSLIYMQNGRRTGTKFDGIRIEDSQMFGTQLINLVPITFQVSLTNFLISNSSISSGKSLIYLTNVRSVIISNYTITQFVSSDEGNDPSIILMINLIDLNGTYQHEIYEVRKASWLPDILFRTLRLVSRQSLSLK